MAPITSESQHAANDTRSDRDTAAAGGALKSMAGLVVGVILIVLSLALAALGQIIALALLLVAIPLVAWGGSKAKPSTLNRAAKTS
jgi:hypothetical protein